MFSRLDSNPFHFLHRKTVSTDLTKPLIIPAGSDSFSQIGNVSLILLTCVINGLLVFEPFCSHVRLPLCNRRGHRFAARQKPARPVEESLWLRLPPRGGAVGGHVDVCRTSLSFSDVFCVERTAAGPEGPSQRSSVQRASD